MSFTYESLPRVQADLRSGKLTCRSIVEHYISRIHAKKHLNAFLEVFETDALAKADEIDGKISRKEKTGSLCGMVIAVKDVIVMKQKKATASSHILENFVSLYTATAVERLMAEDAIIIGRTNCDEFAMGSSNENSFFGNVLNDDDNSKVPGGSSGGSAVAVQAGLCMASLGTDTGGSIRQPASMCGVIGFKPTYGRISRYGLIAYASTFDQLGTFTTSAEDTALLLQAMAGKDEKDSTTSLHPPTDYGDFDDTRKFRIAYYKEALEHPKLDPEIREKHYDLIENLKKEGHHVEARSILSLDYLVPTYYVITTAEASSNLARFAGIHYGYRDPSAANMEEVTRKSRSKGFGKEVKRRIMLGTFVLSSGYYDAYYTRAQKVRNLIRKDTKEILKDFDLILLPTTPTTAFTIGEKTKDPIEMYLADIFTVQANICGLPAISVPLFRHTNGLSFGAQFIADSFDEKTLLTVTKRLLTKY